MRWADKVCLCAARICNRVNFREVLRCVVINKIHDTRTDIAQRKAALNRRNRADDAHIRRINIEGSAFVGLLHVACERIISSDYSAVNSHCIREIGEIKQNESQSVNNPYAGKAIRVDNPHRKK